MHQNIKVSIRKIVEGVNDTLDAVIGPLNVAAEYVERISRGDIPKPITDNYNGDFNEIKNNLNTCIAAVNLLIEDSLMLSEAGVAGRLDTRADASRHEGDFRRIVEGVNDTLDAVIGPLNVAAEYVERISRGDIPQKITDNYNGDFNEIKNNLNNCIEGLQGMVECNFVLHRMAMNDHSKGVEGEYVGVYKSMAESTNEVRDRLLKVTKQLHEIALGDTSQLEELKKVGKRCEQDHLLPALIEVMENINHLIEDIGMLTRSALIGNLDIRMDESRHKGEYKKIVQGVNDTVDAVVCPLNSTANLIERISRGDIPDTITDECYGDFKDITNNLNACINAIHNLIEDSLMLSAAGIEGRLDIRADVSRHQGDFRRIVEGVNDTLDTVIGPLNVAAEYVERISRGEIPEPITDNYNGDFNVLKNNINNCIDGLQGLVECNNILTRMAVNDQTKKVEGEYVGIFASMGEAINLVQARVLNVTNVLEHIAVGNTSRLEELKKIGRRSEQDRLMPSMIKAMENVNILIEDTEMLSKAAVEGKLDTRADALRHQGEYRKVIEGVNETLDAVIVPLNVAADYVERISRGDIPKPITDNYNGDFNEIKNNLNKCISAINNLVADSLMLSKAGIAGQLETRADAVRHQGEFKKIVVGVNDTLDAVIGPVNEAIKVSNEFSNGNFKARVDESLHVEGDFINFKNVLNNIGISVSDVIKSVSSVTLNVVTSTDEASRGADEVAKAAGNVADSSQKSSELTRELRNKIDGINREIVDLSKSNENIANTSKGILAAADEVVRIGKDAQTLGRDTNLKMESVEKIARESVIGITSLTEQIKQIDGIVQLINDITSQINLLSLNAAIEAARAGEHGRGFAVVAGEVKNLATKARNATETIENVVNSVQRDSKKTADAINMSNNEIIDGVNSVNKTLDALNTIIKNATQVTNDISDITKAIERQATISLNVVKASEEGNIMTEEVQREAEGLAAVSEETSASIQEIGASIHEIANLSNKLKSEMEVFQV